MVRQEETRYLFNCDGHVCRIGRNARDNSQLIADADPNDIWIHVDGHSGAHCIIERASPNNIVGDDTIRSCCRKMKSESVQLVNVKRVRFILTIISNIVQTKNPGQVLIKNRSIVTNVTI